MQLFLICVFVALFMQLIERWVPSCDLPGSVTCIRMPVQSHQWNEDTYVWLPNRDHKSVPTAKSHQLYPVAFDGAM
jgi:hypothetical protein